jgi:hypothetical protein
LLRHFVYSEPATKTKITFICHSLPIFNAANASLQVVHRGLCATVHDTPRDPIEIIIHASRIFPNNKLKNILNDELN